MRVGERREAGFDQTLVDAWIGLRPANEKVSDTCIRAGREETTPRCEPEKADAS
jgi:hypothetical protein